MKKVVYTSVVRLQWLEWNAICIYLCLHRYEETRGDRHLHMRNTDSALQGLG